jgi:glucokinase
MYYAGIDLGGTKLSAGLVTETGEVAAEVVTYDHCTGDEQEIINCMVRNIDKALSRVHAGRSDIRGVGVLFPGHVRWPEGITLTTSNLPTLRNYPLKDALSAALNLPVVVDNDANVQTLGEYKYGAGRGCRHMVFLTVSTGVGGGIIIDGHLYRGATGTAGEFGHMIVEASSSVTCPCGNHGCLMAMVSGLALRQTAKRTSDQFVHEGKPFELPSGCLDIDDLDGHMLSKGAMESNELCQSIIKEFGTYIGIGIYNVFQVLNPERVVLGGGLMNLPDLFFKTVQSVFLDKAKAMMYDRLDIRRGELGGQAGILGASVLFDA